MSKYTLEVISKLPEFKNQTLKKHHVAGIDTIGVWGNEPFEIKFKNNTGETIQIKISIDGTDILTGDVANTDVTKDMWVVRGLNEMTLKAWPETHKGGAQFVFTHAGQAVATHTHGDTSSLGIIAVAVFREGYQEPVRFVERHHYHHNNYWWNHYPYYTYGSIISNTPTFGGGGTYGASSFQASGDITCSTNSVGQNSLGGATMDSMTFDSNPMEESVNSSPGVGAGDHVEQNLTYTTGLKEPYFTETLRVKYLWWDDLVAQLKERNVAAPHASGFPGNNAGVMSLGNTPRIKTVDPVKQTQPVFARF